MRRLPVYLLIDCSDSMYGEPIEAVKNGVQVFKDTLNQDPHFLEIVYVSVITFNSEARQVMPLTTLTDFHQPNLQVSGCADLGEALSFMAQCIDTEVLKSTADKKCDWNPMAFIMTNGKVTEDISEGIEDLKKVNWNVVVACAASPEANMDILRKITENIISLENVGRETFKKFFRWGLPSDKDPFGRTLSDYDTVKYYGELPPPPSNVIIKI